MAAYHLGTLCEAASMDRIYISLSHSKCIFLDSFLNLVECVRRYTRDTVISDILSRDQVSITTGRFTCDTLLTATMSFNVIVVVYEGTTVLSRNIGIILKVGIIHLDFETIKYDHAEVMTIN